MSDTSRPDDAPVDAVVHTPGPWRFYDIYGGEYHEVFGPTSPGSDRIAVTSKADARLIAAAPELLAALRSLNEVTNPLLDVDPMDLHRARVKAQNAIEAAAKVL